MSILSTSSKLVRVGDSYSAGEGISIENNTISVTGDYGHAYSAGDNITISDDHIISSKDWSNDIDTAVQNVSAETTAWVSEQGYITDADMSDYALVTDVETTSGLLKMDIDNVSASISGKMDSTAFSDWQNGQYTNDIGGLSNDIDTVSGAVDAISGAVSSLDIPTHQEIIDASGYAYSQSTAWVNNQGYLTAHQDISNLATKSEVDTVSSFLSGAIDYVSANAGDEFPASANDAITAYQTYSGSYLTAHQSLDGYLTKTSADTLYQPIGSYASQTDLEQVSGDLKDDIDYISGVAITAHQDISNKLDTTAFSTVSGTFLTAVDLSNYYTKSETSGATELANAFANIPAGDADVNAYVQSNSSTINDVNSTVQTNSAQWGEGTSVDTVPVAVISPLVTGFSGESAYLGIESTALNLSSYVPVSAIGVNSQGYVSGISGRFISASYARNSYTANYASTAQQANYDINWNNITSYYQPKLTISGEAGTITSINGSAVGASIPEGWELVAGAGISIVDDAENNQTTIRVTGGGAGGDTEVNDYVYNNSATIDNINSVVQSRSGTWNSAVYDITKVQWYSGLWDDTYSTVQVNSANWGGNPEVESYVQTNSGVIDNAVSTYQSNSGSYITQETDWTNIITAASSYAYSEAVAQIPAPFDPTYMSGAIDQNASDIQYISGVAITAHQDISNKLDTTAFSDVSGTFLTAVNIPESANWNDATTAYQNNSASYLTAHQAISAEEWNSNYDTVNTNSGAWGGSALNISAGPGISLSMVDGVLVISVTGGN